MKGYLYLGETKGRLGFWKPSCKMIGKIDSQSLSFQKLHNECELAGKKLLIEPPLTDDTMPGSLLQVESVEIEHIPVPDQYPCPIYNVYCTLVGEERVSASRVKEVITDVVGESYDIMEEDPIEHDTRPSKRSNTRVAQTPNEQIQEESISTCDKHPGYHGVRKPKRTDKYPDGCKQCWAIYYDKHKDKS